MHFLYNMLSTKPIILGASTTESVLDTGIISTISDNGLPIVLSAIVVMFLVKVLNMYVEKDKAITNSIQPTMSEILKGLNQIRISVVEIISSHNMSTNKKFVELSANLANMEKSLKNTEDTLDGVDKRLDGMSEAIAELKVMMQMSIQTNVTKDNKKQSEEE